MPEFRANADFRKLAIPKGSGIFSKVCGLVKFWQKGADERQQVFGY